MGTTVAKEEYWEKQTLPPMTLMALIWNVLEIADDDRDPSPAKNAGSGFQKKAGFQKQGRAIT